MQHAWDGTKTIYGKIALVVFYSLIWLSILSCLWTVLVPTSQGMSCYLNAIAEEPIRTITAAGVRGSAILAIGFLGYADVGGLHTKNVAMVTIVIVAYSIAISMSSGALQEIGCSTMASSIWVWPVWAILALVFMLVEDKLGDRAGTAEEAQHLTT